MDTVPPEVVANQNVSDFIDNEKVPDIVDKKEIESTETHFQDDGLFTSEIFKIEIQNLPKVVGFAQIKKFIASKDLKAIKVKQPAGNCSFAFVTFGSEEEREKALKVLNNAVFKGRTLQAFVGLNLIKYKNNNVIQCNIFKVCESYPGSCFKKKE